MSWVGGIERRKIFLNGTDRNGFIDRLSALAQDGAMEIYAWVLRPIIFICNGRCHDSTL